MTTYAMLANWTEQGILKAKDSPRRLDAAKKALKEMSGVQILLPDHGRL
jgi:uncharacterized protein with GYD domain